MAITISPARLADAAAMAGLLEEMDRFYGVDAVAPLAERVGRLGRGGVRQPDLLPGYLAGRRPACWRLDRVSLVWPRLLALSGYGLST